MKFLTSLFALALAATTLAEDGIPADYKRFTRRTF